MLSALDLSSEDPHAIERRLDAEIPALILGGSTHVVVSLGRRRDLPRSTVDAITLAHHEMRAVGGRLVVIAEPDVAAICAQACPGLLVAATERQAQAGLGLGDTPRAVAP